LTIRPNVPAAWPAFTIDYRYGKSCYTIVVERPAAAGRGSDTIVLDGEELETSAIPLRDDGAAHTVTIRPRPASALDSETN
jgi:cellobiose phosphorylase